MAFSSCRTLVTAVGCLVMIAVMCGGKSIPGPTASRGAHVLSTSSADWSLSTDGRLLEAGGRRTQGMEGKKSSITRSRRKSGSWEVAVGTPTYINHGNNYENEHKYGENADNDKNEDRALYSDYNGDEKMEDRIQTSSEIIDNDERKTQKHSQPRNCKPKKEEQEKDGDNAKDHEDDDVDDDDDSNDENDDESDDDDSNEKDDDCDEKNKGKKKSKKKDRDKKEEKEKDEKDRVDRPQKDTETASKTGVLTAGVIAGIALVVTAVTVVLVLVFLYCYFVKRRDNRSGVNHRPRKPACNTYSLTILAAAGRRLPKPPKTSNLCGSSFPPPPVKFRQGHTASPGDADDVYEFPKEEIDASFRGRALVTKETQDAGVGREQDIAYDVLEHGKNCSSARGAARGNSLFSNRPHQPGHSDSTLAHAYSPLNMLSIEANNYESLVNNTERRDFERELDACGDSPEYTMQTTVPEAVYDAQPALNCESDNGRGLKLSDSAAPALGGSACDTKSRGSESSGGEYRYARPITAPSELTAVSGPDMDTTACQRDQAGIAAGGYDRDTAAVGCSNDAPATAGFSHYANDTSCDSDNEEYLHPPIRDSEIYLHPPNRHEPTCTGEK